METIYNTADKNLDNCRNAASKAGVDDVSDYNQDAADIIKQKDRATKRIRHAKDAALERGKNPETRTVANQFHYLTLCKAENVVYYRFMAKWAEARGEPSLAELYREEERSAQDWLHHYKQRRDTFKEHGDPYLPPGKTVFTNSEEYSDRPWRIGFDPDNYYVTAARQHPSTQDLEEQLAAAEEALQNAVLNEAPRERVEQLEEHVEQLTTDYHATIRSTAETLEEQHEQRNTGELRDA